MTPTPPIDEDIVASVQLICRSLPEVTEHVTEAVYLFEVRRRRFCHLMAPADPSGRPVPMIIFRPDPMEREALLAVGHPFFAARTGPDRVGMLLDSKTDWAEVRELITESYRVVAPKRLAEQLD